MSPEFNKIISQSRQYNCNSNIDLDNLTDQWIKLWYQLGIDSYFGLVVDFLKGFIKAYQRYKNTSMDVWR